MEIRPSIVATTAALFCLCATSAGAQTITFGDSAPAGPVAPGYAGFQWGTGANQAVNYVDDVTSPYFLYSSAPTADVFQFSRSSLFDLNSVDFQILESQLTALDSFDNLSTVVSGYRGATLVKSVTENYPGAGDQLFTGLNIDGVDRITFTTTDTTGYIDGSGSHVAAINTFAGALVDQLKVSNFNSAPELDPGSAAGALTLLLGSLAVLCGSAPSRAGTTRAPCRRWRRPP